MENLLFTGASNVDFKKKKVFVKVNFLKISDINTIKEEFTGDVFIQIRWREPALDNSKDKQLDATKYWSPKIVIGNLQSSSTFKTWTSLKLYDGKAYVVEKRKIRGCFAENLELHEFPFDVQDLSIIVSSELTDDVIEIVEDNDKISAVNVMCFVDETEWTICDLVYCEQRELREVSEAQFRNPALLVKCVAKRRAGFFLYNIVLITTMITSFSFTTFSVDTNLTQNRLQLSFIITLTGVTFKMVTNQSLPKIPYLTHLDRLILGSMIFNWFVCIWHAIVAQFEDETYQKDIDFWAFIIFVILYGIFNVVIFTVIGVKRLLRHFEIKEKETLYQKKVFVKVNFLKISDINTIKEEFAGDVFIQIRWREPALDFTKDTKNVDTSKYWNPKIVVSNVLTTSSQKSWVNVKISNKGNAYIVEKRRIKGTFAENLELHEFPFDIQDLSIVVSSELSDDAIEIVEDDEHISAVNVMCFVDETEWDVCDLVYCEQRMFNREIADTQFKNPALLVKFMAKRRAGFFLYNIILITIMITTLSLTTFSVDINLTQNRLQLSFIITLTGVTFKMVTNQSLPKIPYLTHLIASNQVLPQLHYLTNLDRLILGSMVFNWMVCVWHAVVSLYEDDSRQKDMDFWAFITFVILYALFAVAVSLVIIIKRIIRDIECKEKERVYQEKATRIMGEKWKKERMAKRTAWTRRNKIDAAGQFQMMED